MNITAPLRRRAALEPDRCAIIRADQSRLSYGTLDAAIDQIAHRARALGLGPGSRVAFAIGAPDESAGLVLALALARVGAASVDPSLVDAAMQAGPSHALLEPGRGDDRPDVTIHPDPASICRIFASSGTTGAPKPIAIDHLLMARRVSSSMIATGEGGVRRIIAVNFGITLGFTSLLRTLWQGGTIVLSNPADAPAAIARHDVTHMLIAPTGLSALLKTLPPNAQPTLESLTVSGSRLPVPLHEDAAARLCPNITIHLGASEAGGIASGPAALTRPNAVGYVHVDVDVQAVDRAHEPLPPGTEGIIRVRSPLVIKAPNGSAQFRDGWFYPGDIGAIWPDGMLTLSGRTGDIINSGGVKIDPASIEDALLGLPGVTEAAAFGVADAHGIDQLWAAIAIGTAMDPAKLDQYCQEKLPGCAPRTILQMKALPHTANGKIRKDMLIAYARTQVTPAD